MKKKLIYEFLFLWKIFNRKIFNLIFWDNMLLLIYTPIGYKEEGMKKTIRDEALKKNLTIRLNKIEGQVRGIKKMIDEDIYCNDIITQTTAVISALSAVSNIILENHLKNCLVKDINNQSDEILNEVIETIKKMTKK